MTMDQGAVDVLLGEPEREPCEAAFPHPPHRLLLAGERLCDRLCAAAGSQSLMPGRALGLGGGLQRSTVRVRPAAQTPLYWGGVFVRCTTAYRALPGPVQWLLPMDTLHLLLDTLFGAECRHREEDLRLPTAWDLHFATPVFHLANAGLGMALQQAGLSGLHSVTACIPHMAASCDVDKSQLCLEGNLELNTRLGAGELHLVVEVEALPEALLQAG